MKTLAAWYCRVLARHSGLVLISISTLSVIAIICSLTLHELPDFSDPQAGFETRGTDISRRLTAWENLLDSVSHVGPLTTNPIEAKGMMLSRSKRSANIAQHKRRRRKVQDDVLEYDPLMIQAEPVFSGYFQRRIGWLCGEPMPDYAHVVFRSKTNESLFNWESIISMCTVDSLKLRSQPQFKELCETKGPAHCCPGWSLGGYIGLLHKRSSCFGIQKEDVASTLALLKRCSAHYHSGELTADCLNNPRPCIRVPRECITHNAVFTILHYLTDHDFMSPQNVALNRTHLRYVMSFLPVARSSATLDYFHALNTDTTMIGDDRTEIVAMDLGLKDTLFNEYLIEDAIYLVLALTLISLAILAYTRSVFITIATLLAITYALALAYFIYTFVCGIKFFPFMNVLAAVIAIGVGADDTFILVKSWHAHAKPDPNLNSLEEQLEVMLHSALSHSLLTMCVTSITTSAAFFASFVSTITAIKCFSVFAGLAILCNLALMVSWTPAALAFYARNCQGICCGSRAITLKGNNEAKDAEEKQGSFYIESLKSGVKTIADIPRLCFEQWLPEAIIRPRFAWVVVLGSLIMSSLLIVFYYPKLKLPDKEQFQLFRSDHIFERYDLVYKRYFGFEKDEQQDISYKMPLRFVWGIKPVDSGDYLNPGSRGDLQLDANFDISSTDSQRWMLRFCEQVRKQPFFKPTLGPLLSNCFMETFKEWMKRRCRDEITNEDRAPCCQASNFPYTIPIFERCLVEAIGDLYATPTDFWRPGIAGPKFNLTSHRVEALIVEYDSNVTFSFSHAEMESFYASVNDWFASVISTAPPQLQSGFFLSHLAFYDVQNSLLEDTLTAILLAMLVAVAVVFASTLNIGLTLLAVFTILGVIFVSMAILVFMGWKLNILESVAITLAIGLSVDFTLHYAIMYKNSGSDVAFSVSKMAAPVSMAAFTTLLPGLCMLPSRVLAYVQIGSFIIVLMCTSWFFATFFFQACLHILGPNALNIMDSIPEDTCCGRKIKAKKQRETWAASGKGKAESPTMTSEPGEDKKVNGADLNRSTFISVESGMTHISNGTNDVNPSVTTVAAQVQNNAEPIMVSSINVNHHGHGAAAMVDVFKSSNLREEDLQDGRVTLPIKKTREVESKTPSPPPMPSPTPLAVSAEDNLPSAPSLEIIELPLPSSSTKETPPLNSRGGKNSTAENMIFETALIHSDSPTIRADPACFKKQPQDSKKLRRSGSSGTVLEFLPANMQMETIEIDLTTPVPKQSIVMTTIASSNVESNSYKHHPTTVSEGLTQQSFAHTQIIQPAIRSIIKSKKTGPHHNAYHGYFYVEEAPPPPPPPHAYELQPYHQHQIMPYFPDNYHIYAEPPPPQLAELEQTAAVPCSQRNFEVFNELQHEEIQESVAASRRRRKSKTKSLLPLEADPELLMIAQQQPCTEEEVISQVMSKARQTRSKSCHERSDSLKKYTKRKLAPDEDLITVVTDDHLHPTKNTLCHQASVSSAPVQQSSIPKPKPRKSLGRSRTGSASLGNILAVNPDDYLETNEAYHICHQQPMETSRQTLPRMPKPRQQHYEEESPQVPTEIYYVPTTTTTTSKPKPTPRKSSNSSSYRHPLSLSTETILFNDDKYDPNPIVPNRAPDVPDIWLPMRSVKA